MPFSRLPQAPNKPALSSIAVALLSLGFTSSVLAQAPVGAELPAVTITAAPLGAGAAAVPSTVLAGDGLTLRKSNSLGDVLSGELGVASTGFGTNASRPVIRGLDADRIKILSNGGASHDVAALSFDHATPIDPLVVQRIEVLRGPATLLFGGGAVGGVVNAIDNRIPSEALDGLGGQIELRGDSAKREDSASAVLETALSKDWMLHVDGFKRKSSSTAVPVALPCTVNGAAVTEKKICNTQAQSNGGAIGVSRVWNSGFVGASLSTYRSDYGTPAEDEVTIGMKSNTLSIKGEQRGLTGLLSSVAAQASSTRYTHTEFDAGTPATVFNKRGSDARLELRQTASQLAGRTLTGTTLVSIESERFQALGAEAFVPENKTTHTAIATLQTLAMPWGAITTGARLDSVSTASSGGAQTDYSGADKFIPAKRSFAPRSMALSSVVNLNAHTQLTGSVALSQRAPTAYELFANGPHIASGAYEIGNADLRIERSRNVDVGVQWKQGNSSFKLGGFYNQFKNYINLANTGASIGADGEPNPLDVDGDGNADGSGEGIYTHYQYQAIRARLMGFEIQAKHRVQLGALSLDLNAKLDTLNAVNTDTREALPRIAPTRVTLGLTGKQQGWTGQIEWQHSALQSKVPAYDLLGATPAHSLVNLSLSYRKPQRDSLLWFVKLDNALNKLAYNAVTIDTVRGKSPLAGRSLKLGVQLAF